MAFDGFEGLGLANFDQTINEESQEEKQEPHMQKMETLSNSRGCRAGSSMPEESQSCEWDVAQATKVHRFVTCHVMCFSVLGLHGAAFGFLRRCASRHAHST